MAIALTKQHDETVCCRCCSSMQCGLASLSINTHVQARTNRYVMCSVLPLQCYYCPIWDVITVPSGTFLV